jgi:membrane protein
MKKLLLSLCTAALIALANPVAWAQDADFENKAKALLAQAEPGPKTIDLGAQASMQLPAGMAFLPKQPADKLMQMVGNGTDPNRYGIIIPTSEEDDWMADLSYIDSGYIKDDDAKNWDVDALLKNIKEGTKEQNKERAERGIPPLEVGGWVEKPHYDAATRHLIYSVDAKTVGEATPSVNYNTYALGRYGYISLNFVADLDTIERYKPTAQQLLAAIEYRAGQRYADFNPTTDKIAEYGIAALVGGLAAKKLGLLAVIAAFAVKFSKLLIVGAVGVIYGVKKLFGGRRREEDDE